jgi:hypothetical protein
VVYENADGSQQFFEGTGTSRSGHGKASSPQLVLTADAGYRPSSAVPSGTNLELSGRVTGLYHVHASCCDVFGYLAIESSPRSRERCESGRIGLTANELTWETGSEGSNPSLSAL